MIVAREVWLVPGIPAEENNLASLISSGRSRARAPWRDLGSS